MKKIKLFYLDGYYAALDVLQRRLNDYLKTAGRVDGLTVKEGTNAHDIIVIVSHEQTSGSEGTQGCVLSGWIQTSDLESCVDQMTEKHSVSHLSVHTCAKSNRRNVVVAIVEKAGAKEEAKQDEGLDAKPDQRPESGVVGNDRAMDERRAEANGTVLHKEVREDLGKKARTKQRGLGKRSKVGSVEGTPVLQQGQGEDADVPEHSGS